MKRILFYIQAKIPWKLGNHGNSLLHFFGKNFVKATILQKNLLHNSWFDEFFLMRVFFATVCGVRFWLSNHTVNWFYGIFFSSWDLKAVVNIWNHFFFRRSFSIHALRIWLEPTHTFVALRWPKCSSQISTLGRHLETWSKKSESGGKRRREEFAKNVCRLFK